GKGPPYGNWEKAKFPCNRKATPKNNPAKRFFILHLPDFPDYPHIPKPCTQKSHLSSLSGIDRIKVNLKKIRK
ncbi:MAG: hypothetical protein ACK47R_24930, partial [Planctomycetia bacterium]